MRIVYRVVQSAAFLAFHGLLCYQVSYVYHVAQFAQLSGSLAPLEECFCRAFVNDKYRFAKWGKVKIAQALQLKKISYNTCRQFLNEIDEEEYLYILDSLLTAKRKSIHAENEYELNGKLMRFALSRGFEMKDIRHCIQLSDENDDFE